jgi:hypothetical protein
MFAGILHAFADAIADQQQVSSRRKFLFRRPAPKTPGHADRLPLADKSGVRGDSLLDDLAHLPPLRRRIEADPAGDPR